jgi:hypothetical protein
VLATPTVVARPLVVFEDAAVAPRLPHAATLSAVGDSTVREVMKVKRLPTVMLAPLSRSSEPGSDGALSNPASDHANA